MADPLPSVDRSGDVALVITTLPDMTSGEALVRTLVDERLIACGNLVPGVLSIYRWEGRVVREPEVLVVMKSVATSVENLFGRIKDLHPYAVPEMAEVPLGAVGRAYSDWVKDSSKVEA